MKKNHLSRAVPAAILLCAPFFATAAQEIKPAPRSAPRR
jgi:hypothetical protein